MWLSDALESQLCYTDAKRERGRLVASTSTLATKLYIHPPPPKVVVRARLIEQLDDRLSVFQASQFEVVCFPGGQA